MPIVARTSVSTARASAPSFRYTAADTTTQLPTRAAVTAYALSRSRRIVLPGTVGVMWNRAAVDAARVAALSHRRSGGRNGRRGRGGWSGRRRGGFVLFLVEQVPDRAEHEEDDAEPLPEVQF